MKNTKDIKVLLVEDSQVQIDWAKNQLSGYNLTIVTHEAGFSIPPSENSKLLKGKYDIKITDLELPKEDGGIPKANTGFNLFMQMLRDVQAGKFSGLAMVSNFEHHVTMRENNEDLYSIVNKLKMLYDLTAKISSHSTDFAISKEANRINNIVMLCDTLFIWDYPHYWMEEKVFSNKELKEKFGPGYDFCKTGAVPLKPYKEVVGYLSQFVK